jgi:hypothetical protein
MATLPVTQQITYHVSSDGYLNNAFVRAPNGYRVEMQRFWEPLR